MSCDLQEPEIQHVSAPLVGHTFQPLDIQKLSSGKSFTNKAADLKRLARGGYAGEGS